MSDAVKLRGELVNLTPHPVNVIDGDSEVSIDPTRPAARALFEETGISTFAGVDIVDITFMGFEGLPDPEPGRWLIVSAVVANLAPSVGRTTIDLLTPHQPIRDDAGQIIGCRALAKVPR